MKPPRARTCSEERTEQGVGREDGGRAEPCRTGRDKASPRHHLVTERGSNSKERAAGHQAEKTHGGLSVYQWLAKRSETARSGARAALRHESSDLRRMGALWANMWRVGRSTSRPANDDSGRPVHRESTREGARCSLPLTGRALAVNTPPVRCALLVNSPARKASVAALSVSSPTRESCPPRSPDGAGAPWPPLRGGSACASLCPADPLCRLA